MVYKCSNAEKGSAAARSLLEEACNPGRGGRAKRLKAGGDAGVEVRAGAIQVRAAFAE